MRPVSCGKVHTIVTEGDDIRVLGATVSFKTGRRRVVQISQPVMRDSRERSVSSFQGWLFSESGQSQFMRGQCIRTGCLVMIGIERWESYDGNKPGHLCKDCSVYKKRITEKGNNPKGKIVETTVVVQGVMVETLEYEDGMLTENRSGFVSELTTRGTTPSLSPISRSSIEQRGFKKVHWTERGFKYVDRVESVVSCHERFEFEDEWDIGCVHLFE